MGKAAAGGRRETWRDWQDKRAPAPPLLTRAEVLALVDSWGLERRVEERTLRFWEQRGLIPRPTLEHRGGVTRTWYPSWVPDLVAELLRRRQQSRRKLADLRDEMHAEARRLSLDPRAYPSPRLQAEDDPFWRFLSGRDPHLRDRVRQLFDGPRYAPPRTFDPPKLPESLEWLIAYYMDPAIRDQYRRHRFTTTRIEVRLLDAQGRDRTYVVPLPADYDPDPVEAALAALAANEDLGEGEEGWVTPPPPP